MIAAVGLSVASLPEIAAPQQTFNRLANAYVSRWPQLSEARLFPAVGDGAANSIGSGCHSTEKLALMIGTSGAMRVCFVGVPPESLPPELWCYRANRNRILIGGALSDGGGLFNWLKESLLPAESFATLEAELELVSPDAHGLTVMPFWAGERSTGWNPSARGAILGISLQTLPSEILRAAMEAIAYRFALIAAALEPFAPGATLVASGNALRSSATWVQILADVLGRSVLVSERSEASIRGAALLALEAAGKIQSIEEFSVSVSTPVETVCEPTCSSCVLSGRARSQQRIIKSYDLTVTQIDGEMSAPVQEENITPTPDLDQLCINTIRTLSLDAVQKAESGHPGLPLGAAPMAYVLWTRFLRHNPQNPKWENRDRFLLSAGHGSMLLYSLLHLTGYDLPLDESKIPPVWIKLQAILIWTDARSEITTGPLGQGFANGVGMAMGAAHLGAKFNKEGFSLIDHFVYAIVSDGDLMEGVAAEAASLAGHLQLGKLIYLYDDNHVTIEGFTKLAFSEDVPKRFEAYGCTR